MQQITFSMETYIQTYASLLINHAIHTDKKEKKTE
jgi:hypothetical protein